MAKIEKIVKFGAEWCQPCKMVQNIMERYFLKTDTDTEFFALDVDEEDADLIYEVRIKDENGEIITDIETLLDKFNIKNTPTVIAFLDNGQEVAYRTAFTEEQFKNWIAELESK